MAVQTAQMLVKLQVTQQPTEVAVEEQVVHKQTEGLATEEVA
jgi:hypothetical protein